MPELVPHSTSSPSPPPIPPAALPPDKPERPYVPPAFEPDAWERFPAFRQTFMMYVTPPGYSAALQTMGEMLYSLILETPEEWPEWTESATRVEMRAVAYDLRHLQGFLAAVGREREVSSLDAEDAYLSTIAKRLARQIGGAAAWIEKELAGVR